MKHSGGVCFGHRVGSGDGDPQRLLQPHALRSDELSERLAAAVLEHEEIRVALLADVVERDNFRVLKRRDETRFLDEPLTGFRRCTSRRLQNLDRDRAAKAVIFARYTSPMPPAPRSDSIV
jgi:hypothetical protein